LADFSGENNVSNSEEYIVHPIASAPVPGNSDDASTQSTQGSFTVYELKIRDEASFGIRRGAKQLVAAVLTAINPASGVIHNA
jgi:hypothetical protein